MASAETLAANWRSQPRQHTLTLARAPARLALVVLVVALVVLALESLLLTARTPLLRLTFDSRESAALLQGFHAPEQDASRHAIGGGTYRWTSGSSTIHLPQVGMPLALARPPHLVLTLSLGPSLPGQAASSFAPTCNGVAYGSIAVDTRPRRYHLLLPAGALDSGSVSLTLPSDTATVPPDPRPVGLRVEGLTLHTLAAPVVVIAPLAAGGQVVLLGMVGLLLARLAMPLRSSSVLVVVAAGLLVLLQHYSLLAYPYLVRLGVACALLVLLTYGLLPLAERHAARFAAPATVRLVWGIMLLGCAIRLTGSLYPLFAPYDLSHNVERLIKTIAGTLVVTSRSIEFRNGITVYPPGPYLFLLPGNLLGIAPAMLVQGGIAIVDGVGVLTSAALARALGTSNRAALLCALLYAAIPINLTALWWGHTAQIFGQALMPPLAVVLLLLFGQARAQPASPPLPPWWRDSAALLSGLLLSVAMLSHIGVTIVAVGWLGLVGALLLLRRTLPGRLWWRFFGVVVGACLASLLLIYSAVALLKLQQLFVVGEKVMTSDYVPAYGLIWRGFRIAFHRLGFVMLLPGLLLLCSRRLPPGGIEIMLGWLGAVLVFLAIEVMSALQVRYIYFLTPLACIAIALLLDRLAARSRIARLAAWVVGVLLLAQGSIYWYTGTFEDVMMSVSPLVR